MRDRHFEAGAAQDACGVFRAEDGTMLSAGTTVAHVQMGESALPESESGILDQRDGVCHELRRFGLSFQIPAHFVIQSGEMTELRFTSRIREETAIKDKAPSVSVRIGWDAALVITEGTKLDVQHGISVIVHGMDGQRQPSERGCADSGSDRGYALVPPPRRAWQAVTG